MHLLYVDDDRINLMLFENACAALPGLQLSTAADGAEALQRVREMPPQLMVIDLHLPDTDGPALLRVLRREDGLAGVPAFLCSADDGPELRALATDAGFQGCWSKPIDGQGLRRELEALGMVPAA
jgi:CheY-like chemotaxis protein